MWIDHCLELLPLAAKKYPQGAIGETLRLWLEPKVGDPGEKHWGAMIKEAIACKILIPTGKYEHMRTKKSHGRKSEIYLIADFPVKNLFTGLKNT